MKCQNPGCGLHMQSRDMNQHIKYYCAYSKNRKILATKSLTRLNEINLNALPPVPLSPQEEDNNNLTTTTGTGTFSPHYSPKNNTNQDYQYHKEDTTSLCPQCGEAFKVNQSHRFRFSRANKKPQK